MSADLSLRRNLRDLFVRAFLGGFWGWAILAIMGINRNVPPAVAATAGILAWIWAAAWIAFIALWVATRLELSGDRVVRRSPVRRREVDLSRLERAFLDPDRPYADDPSFGMPRLFDTSPDLVLRDAAGGEVRVGLGGEFLGARPFFAHVHDVLQRPDVTADERTRFNVAYLAGATTTRPIR